MQFVFPQQKQVASQIHKTLQVFAESQGEIRLLTSCIHQHFIKAMQ